MGNKNALEKHVACDENLVHIKVVFRTLQFYISKSLYFRFSIKCNKDCGIQNRDKILSFFCRIELYLINLKGLGPSFYCLGFLRVGLIFF